MTSTAATSTSALPRWLVPALVALVAASALASWLLVRDGGDATVAPTVVTAPETATLHAEAGNDPAALKLPKAKKQSSGGGGSASTTAAASAASTTSQATAPSTSTSRSTTQVTQPKSSGAEPAALEFGR